MDSSGSSDDHPTPQVIFGGNRYFSHTRGFFSVARDYGRQDLAVGWGECSFDALDSNLPNTAHLLAIRLHFDENLRSARKARRLVSWIRQGKMARKALAVVLEPSKKKRGPPKMKTWPDQLPQVLHARRCVPAGIPRAYAREIAARPSRHTRPARSSRRPPLCPCN